MSCLHWLVEQKQKLVFAVNKCRLDEHNTFLSKTLKISMGPNFWPVLCVHIHHPVLFCTQRRRSHFFSPRSHPYLLCFAPFSSIERLSLHCSPNWKIMDLINWSLNAIDTIFGFRGTWLPRRNVRSGLYDGRVGEVANRVSCGSFLGGHWRYLPIRNHDNRYFADWIRLCPGL